MKIVKAAVFVAGMLSMISGAAFAGDYQCTVYCTGPSGSTVVTIRAGSASAAAAIIDKTADQICRSAGHRAATSATMSSSQCR